jgi:Polysaccharide lyase
VNGAARLALGAIIAIGAGGCAAPSLRPGKVPLGPRWRGDFETGDLSQWTYLLNPGGLSVVASPVAEGHRAGRVELTERDLWPNGLNRVELQEKPPRATFAEGARSCFAWRFFLPVPLSEGRHQIGYFESYPSYRQIMSVEVRGQTIAFVTRLPAEHVHWTAAGAATPDVWHQVAICGRWSADPASGSVDVWFDRRAVVVHGAARTLWNGDPNQIQIGLLRDVPAAPEIMFLDDALEDADFGPEATAR